MIYVYRNEEQDVWTGLASRQVILSEFVLEYPGMSLLGTIPLQPVQPEPKRDMDDNEMVP